MVLMVINTLRTPKIYFRYSYRHTLKPSNKTNQLDLVRTFNSKEPKSIGIELD
jgi:hypothetical protein